MGLGLNALRRGASRRITMLRTAGLQASGGVRGREQFRGISTFVYAVCVMGHGARVTKHLLQVP